MNAKDFRSKPWFRLSRVLLIPLSVVHSSSRLDYVDVYVVSIENQSCTWVPVSF